MLAAMQRAAVGAASVRRLPPRVPPRRRPPPSLPSFHEKRAAPLPVAVEDSLSVVEANCAHLATFTAKSDTKLVTLVICFAPWRNSADLDQLMLH